VDNRNTMQEPLSVKLFVGNDVRRFAFTPMSLTELKQKCLIISEMKENEEAVTLKYYDNEGDLISLSSDLELEYAISLCSKNLLRLVMETRKDESFSTSWRDPPPEHGHFGNYGHFGRGHFGRGGHFGGRMRGGGRFPGNDVMSWRGEKLKKVKELDAQFVAHSLVEDNSSIPVGTKFLKSWRFRNIGSIPWPEGCSFIRVSKLNNDLSAPESTVVPITGPYQEIDITVELKTPIVPGQYEVFFRLCTPWGKKFGQRVRCRVVAVDQVSLSREKIDVIWNNLEEMQLVEKGARPGKIAELIVQYRGDMNHIVREICSNK